MEKMLKGRGAAEAIEKEISDKLPALYERGIVPTLAIVRVGESESDIAYENGAVNKAKKLGVQTEKFICGEDIEQEDFTAVINAINDNDQIHGVLLLQPLPEHIDAMAVRNAITQTKDLDCVSDSSLAEFFIRGAGFAPCTAESCIEILDHYKIPVEGKKAVVIGRSMVIGRPVALMLMRRNATVTVCHTSTDKESLKNYCLDADIIISAAGKANTVTADMVKQGQTIIDVGINFNEEGKMLGDVDFETVSHIAGGITPVPGGVGGVTTAVLMRHLVIAAGKRESQ